MVGKAPTKTEIFNAIAESTQLTKKDIAAVFDALSAEVATAVQGPGQFTIPGLCKVTVRETPAKPKRKGRNPATGEEIWLQPKPASKKVTIRPLKALKEMI
ncbi:DNA-binding protein HU 1 [Rosistilla oblonga]|uniref:Viral histone-like protein n=2 Tax=Rosistilla TaxID=2795779 RepID=A0A518IPG2_9BACT|nr:MULTISPECIES: HU family DNA-binding protein [Rosistilla]QDV10848.1 DNA-binding protein HU 1 [Rosistilla oblonga]QDV54962.1 DNA-binding protein HU 1 [Rosistilla oblonga]QDV67388.1 DNA-binding protein HU 1 [Rosistilla carotiformis]|eukprot:TRINITY_DN62163_c0_g1_i1.p2 TRINITY_DN62163_c0_g1~~TRINITY_DN62163_c0_g1_i1.p2  ORF type:complete len:101 (+),score=12.45 TRINITY_DN62163_c0_g1_i1:35-337(+)